MKRILLLLLSFLFYYIHGFPKSATTRYSVAFYNLENLYDTKRDSRIDDREFTPEGIKRWTEDKYQKKLNNISYVIDRMGKESASGSPIMIGVTEIENKKVLEDLLRTKRLKNIGYEFVHRDSPDKRGIDVALLYNPKVFKMDSYKVYPFKSKDAPHVRTRDILLVKGKLNNETIHVIVVHWPSRLKDGSSEEREFAASICKGICDSILKSNPKAKIIIMGDMNDNPNDKSCRLVLKAKKKKSDVKPGELYNPMWELWESGIGSSKYKGKWQMFDQFIVSESFLNKASPLRYWKCEVFNPDYLIQKSGGFKGYPLRTFSGNTFLNGYSDHFPILIYFNYEKK